MAWLPTRSARIGGLLGTVALLGLCALASLAIGSRSIPLGEVYAQFSQEQFRLMDQDVVVMYGARDDILANPVFKRLDAVRADRVIYLDLTDQFASALSLPYLLDEAQDALAAAVDGDPSTPVSQPG